MGGNPDVKTGKDPATLSYTMTHTGAVENNPAFSGGYRILKYSPEGEFISSLSFSYVSPTGAPARGLVVREGGFLVYTAMDILLLDEGGKIEQALADQDLQIFGIQRCDMGMLASCWNNGPENHGPLTVKIGPDGSKEILPCQAASLSPCQAMDGKYLLNTGTDFVNWDFEAEQQLDLLSWNYGDAMGSNCTGVIQLGPRSFAYTTSGGEAVRLISAVAVPRTEKSVVKVAVCGAATAKATLLGLNNSDSLYYYEYTEYKDSELDRLLTEISAGEGPDLILFNNNVDTSSDAFLDLYTLIDQDPQLSRESFVPGLLPAIEIKGELHTIWTSFEIDTLAIRSADAPEGPDLTIEDLDRILAGNSQYKAVFDTYMTRHNLLSWLGNISTGKYIDWSNATCDFTEPSFAQLLAWCDEMELDYSGEVAPYSHDQSEIILSTEFFDVAARINAIRNNFQAPIIFEGFPNCGGRGNFFQQNSGCSAAIPANSRNIEGAWALIHERLMTSNQIDAYPGDGFPAIMEAFERAVSGDCDEEGYDQILDLLSRTDRAIRWEDWKIVEMITGSGTAYLAGDKSLEDTVALIQSRVSIYLSEKFG